MGRSHPSDRMSPFTDNSRAGRELYQSGGHAIGIRGCLKELRLRTDDLRESLRSIPHRPMCSRSAPSSVKKASRTSQHAGGDGGASSSAPTGAHVPRRDEFHHWSQLGAFRREKKFPDNLPSPPTAAPTSALVWWERRAVTPDVLQDSEDTYLETKAAGYARCSAFPPAEIVLIGVSSLPHARRTVHETRRSSWSKLAPTGGGSLSRTRSVRSSCVTSQAELARHLDNWATASDFTADAPRRVTRLPTDPRFAYTSLADRPSFAEIFRYLVALANTARRSRANWSRGVEDPSRNALERARPDGLCHRSDS